MRNKKFVALLVSAILMVTMLSACGGGGGGTTPGTTPAGSEPPAETIKVGLIAPETGNVAVYGLAVENGVKLYAEELNAAGGINGKMIELIAYDDKGDPVEAKNAYDRLISSDEVVAVIGPVTSNPTFGVAQASADDNIPGITASATHPEVTTYGDNYFRVCFLDSMQGEIITEFAKAELEAASAAIIYNASDPYSTGLKDSIVGKAAELELTITLVESYAEGDVDFNAQLTNILATNPEVLFVPDYYNTIYNICSQARAAGFEGTFVGVDGADGALTIEGADYSVFENLYFANHYAPSDEAEVVANFRAAFEAKYTETPNSFAALGYDAAKILFAALEAVDNSDVALAATEESYQAVIDALAATDLECVTGNISFDEEGDPIKNITIIKVENGEYVFCGKY